MNQDQDNSAGVAGNGPSFSVNDHDRTLIRSIVARAFRDAHLRACLDFIDESADDARQALTMDITACHANGCPVNLAKLLDADDVTFGHDITGIQRHIDRRTGKLRRAFGPRTMLSDGERALLAQQEGRKRADMDNLLAAAKQSGRAEFALEVAREREAEQKRRKDRQRKARNARRRKGSGTKSSHSPRAATRRPGRR